MQKIEINIKAKEDELYYNRLVLYKDGKQIHNYGVFGVSHTNYFCIVARLEKLLETVTVKQILDKCVMNSCTVRMGNLDFKL
ncbi:hypothetical protein PXD04_10250 [Methanosphaera sp. ISO3-F5]|uniref:hypothetical protein n=1 Tax=Methanosphaera sp. ISO3-F5 TaxID=1452353 RepID=UPI002B2631EB|nr:hypothetical protein [Methanosphaera sp. ISO3-F5]WQH64071.1 hypothetical protein PXD04_10250 [Methanosphaera sp. ISO3-F5]